MQEIAILVKEMSQHISFLVRKPRLFPLGYKIANVSTMWPCYNSWVKHCLGLTCHCFRKELRMSVSRKEIDFFPLSKELPKILRLSILNKQWCLLIAEWVNILYLMFSPKLKLLIIVTKEYSIVLAFLDVSNTVYCSQFHTKG